jgi:hypothetical protein
MLSLFRLMVCATGESEAGISLHPTFRWGPELRLWVLWGPLCVTYHHSADEPEHDTSYEKRTTNVTCQIRTLLARYTANRSGTKTRLMTKPRPIARTLIAVLMTITI